MATGHIMNGDWALPGRPDMYINIHEVINLIKLRQIAPQYITIDNIAYKDLSCISPGSLRYKLANSSYPGIVVEGMVNPYKKKYRLIDGRHRLLKILRRGGSKFKVFVLQEVDIKRFCYYL